MYPLGVIIDCLCVFIGTNIGCFMQNRLPEKLKHSLHDVFGVAAIAIGITSLIKLSSLPAVILSLILGMIVGELLDAEKHIKSFFSKILLKFKFVYSILYKPCIFKAYRLLNVQTLCIFPCFCPYEPKQGKFFILRRLPYPAVLRKYASLPL